jgi:hypothetical protein
MGTHFAIIKAGLHVRNAQQGQLVSEEDQVLHHFRIEGFSRPVQGVPEQCWKKKKKN